MASTVGRVSLCRTAGISDCRSLSDVLSGALRVLGPMQAQIFVGPSTTFLTALLLVKLVMPDVG